MDERKKKQTIDTYNTTASAMAEKFNNIGARIEDIERGLSFVEKENPRVLEIGCGNGRDAREILKNTSDYTGIDISVEMIKLAEEYAPEGHYVVADIDEYNFPSEIDIIFSFASLLHSDKESVARVLERAHEA